MTHYVLKPHTRTRSEWELLEALRRELVGGRFTTSRHEAERFVKFARGLAQGKLLDALESVLIAPTNPIKPDATGDYAYFVPFVRGPRGARPFGMDTRHGHLVFVFVELGDIYQEYFKASAADLKDGFSLETAAVAVSRPEKLGPTLADHMPKGLTFFPVVQGSERFDTLMRELARDEIWRS